MAILAAADPASPLRTSFHIELTVTGGYMPHPVVSGIATWHLLKTMILIVTDTAAYASSRSCECYWQ